MHIFLEISWVFFLKNKKKYVNGICTVCSAQKSKVCSTKIVDVQWDYVGGLVYNNQRLYSYLGQCVVNKNANVSGGIQGRFGSLDITSHKRKKKHYYVAMGKRKFRLFKKNIFKKIQFSFSQRTFKFHFWFPFFPIVSEREKREGIILGFMWFFFGVL